MPRHSLAEFLDDFYRHGSEIAVVQRRGYRTVRWTYREIADTSCRFARELEARNVKRGDRVVLWGENCAEWVAAFWGCILRGAVAVPMDRIASPDFALRVCREAQARLLVCSADRAGLESAPPVLPLETLVETLAHHSSAPIRASFERTDTAEIIFTSGTTAEPKGVVISHGNLLANLEPLEAGINEYRKYERLVHPLRFLNLVPLSHVFGQLMGVFVVPLLAGVVVFQDSLNPAEVVRTIQRERVSVLVAVPRLVESLQAKIERDLDSEGRLGWLRQQFDFAAGERFLRRWWRFRSLHRRFGWKFWAIVCGGARLETATESFWNRLGFVLIQGYGLTETTSLISLNHPFRLSRGSIGQVLPGRQIKLDSSGEILVRGESIASGYLQGRELRLVPGEDGWFATGDLGAMDDQGNLFFKGRKKNVIVTPEGMNIYPEDLEAALRRQPEVRDAAVVTLDQGGREEPCAVVILQHDAKDRADPSAGVETLLEAVVRRANQSLAEYQRMRRWFLWPDQDFPRTSTQKPRTSAIRAAVATQLGATASRLPIGGGGGSSALAEMIARVTGRDVTLKPDASLEADLHLTSIERVELMSVIEDRYQTDLNETGFQAATTVQELESYLHQVPAGRTPDAYPRWAQRWPAALLRLLAYYLLTWPATALRAWPRVRGRKLLRDLEGPALVVCNHVTEIDPGFVLFALPARLRHRLAVAMNGEHLHELRHPPESLNWLRRIADRLSYFLLVALFNVFPLPKLSGVRASFQYAGESLDRGYSVLIFPEGELTKDGRIAPFRTGIGVLAQQLRVPVIPMRIDGLYELKRAGKRIARPGSVTVTIGDPLRFDSTADPAAIAAELQSKVESLASTSTPKN